MAATKPRARLTARKGDPFPNGNLTVEVEGRIAWAIEVLSNAGRQGVSRMEHASTSLPVYVHKLRHSYGLAIRTVMEQHGGTYAGPHARYFLKTPLTVTALPPETRKPATAATVRASYPTKSNEQAGGQSDDQ